MNITVAKNTFLKNLEKFEGLTLQVNDFERLIEIIRYLAHTDLINAIATKDVDIIRKSISDILSNDIKGDRDPICILFNKNEINYVKSSYIKEIYTSNRLGGLLFEKEVVYSEKNMIDAFKLKCLNTIIDDVLLINKRSLKGYFLNFIRISGFFKAIGKKSRDYQYTSFSESNAGYIKAKSIPYNDIILTESKKTEIIEELTSLFPLFISELNNSRGIYYYYHKVQEISELRNKNILDILYRGTEV